MRYGGTVLRFLLQVFGVALILSGGLWTLQGLGIVMWPSESFMLAEKRWAFYGAVTLVAGLVLVWASRRKR